MASHIKLEECRRRHTLYCVPTQTPTEEPFCSQPGARKTTCTMCVKSEASSCASFTMLRKWISLLLLSPFGQGASVGSQSGMPCDWVRQGKFVWQSALHAQESWNTFCGIAQEKSCCILRFVLYCQILQVCKWGARTWRA